jgi:hypothetical protein
MYHRNTDTLRDRLHDVALDLAALCFCAADDARRWWAHKVMGRPAELDRFA